MNILNITFNSIKATKSSMPKGKIGVKSNTKLDSLTEAKMGLDKTKTALKFGFIYTTEYTPNFAEIELKGEATTLMEKKEADKIQEQWAKNKTKSLDQKFAATLINSMMAKCAIQAMIMAKELSLPSPIPLPRINLEQTKFEKK
ncbi:hypothetical protein K9L67_01320 [Candidatus Woesearchaeota archaeon]|nr:hypothetical protein [Candidatus Woesearchaeota archaeon]MCF7900844.1 hypothetical protein [Candidatus Woesearchaeota archaeon]MCF8013834.1 hypothetical protein [Candidatus Woesearchaeota archaeon]